MRNHIGMNTMDQRIGIEPTTQASSGAAGTIELDFGAFPGSTHASTVVTGQSGIQADSVVRAWLLPADTADHSADEHLLEDVRVFACLIQPGVGFTVHALTPAIATSPYAVFQTMLGRASAWGGRGRQDVPASVYKYPGSALVYGRFTAAWEWR